jgi:hypothetical protein
VKPFLKTRQLRKYARIALGANFIDHNARRSLLQKDYFNISEFRAKLRNSGREAETAASPASKGPPTGAIGFGLWLLAAALAHGAQYSLVALNRHEWGAVLYVVAMVLAVLALIRRDCCSSPPDSFGRAA